jgi:hypothetical protein
MERGMAHLLGRKQARWQVAALRDLLAIGDLEVGLASLEGEREGGEIRGARSAISTMKLASMKGFQIHPGPHCSLDFAGSPQNRCVLGKPAKLPLPPLMKSFFQLLAILFLAGCTTADVQQTGGGIGSAKVATIQIEDSGLDADAKEEFLKRDISGKLQAALKAKLWRAGKLDEKGASLVVTVTEMRVRSTAAVVWVGIMAGRDGVTATAKLVQGNKTLREFTAEAHKFGGAFAGASATGRVERMCEELAEELARQL